MAITILSYLLDRMLRRIAKLTLPLVGFVRPVLGVGAKAKRRGYVDIRR